VTGRAPFDGPGSGDLIAAHLREPPPLASSRVPELPGIVDDLLQRCLQKAPALRFSSMAILVRALAAAEHAMAVPSGALSSDAPGWPVMSELTTTLPSAWAGTNLSNPTTLNDASGQAGAPPRSAAFQRRTQRWLAGIVTALMAAVVTVLVIGQWSDGNTTSTGGVAPASGSSPGTSPLVTSDARSAALPVSPPLPPGAPESGDPGSAASLADAGVADACVSGPTIDSGVVPNRRRAPTGTQRPSAGRDHEGSAGSAVPSFDPGD
jgi:serine/threonine protein kinase